MEHPALESINVDEQVPGTVVGGPAFVAPADFCVRHESVSGGVRIVSPSFMARTGPSGSVT